MYAFLNSHSNILQFNLGDVTDVTIDIDGPIALEGITNFDNITKVCFNIPHNATQDMVTSLDSLAEWKGLHTLRIYNNSPNITDFNISKVSETLKELDIESVTTLYASNEEFKTLGTLLICQPTFILTQPIEDLRLNFINIDQISIVIRANIDTLYCNFNETKPKCKLNIDESITISDIVCVTNKYREEFEETVFTPMKEYFEAHSKTYLHNLFLGVPGAIVDIRGKRVKVTNTDGFTSHNALAITLEELKRILEQKSYIQVTSLHDIFPNNDLFPDIKNIAIRQPTFSITRPVNSCKSSCKTLDVNHHVTHLELLNSPTTDEPKVTFAENVFIKTITINVKITSFAKAVKKYISTHPTTRCKYLFTKDSGFIARYIDHMPNIPTHLGAKIGSYLNDDIPLRMKMTETNIRNSKVNELSHSDQSAPLTHKRDRKYFGGWRTKYRRTKYRRTKSKRRKKTRRMNKRCTTRRTDQIT